MGRRSRKRPVRDGAGRPATAPAAPEPKLRGEERNAMIRAGLEPLGPGERPRTLAIAAIVAAVLAALNVIFYIAGVDVRGKEPQLTGVLLFAGVMLVAAGGMWAKRYWAVLGFQALLAISLVVAGLSLMVAGNLSAVALCLFILVFGGWLFWSLVRVLARLKVPKPGD